MAHNAQQLDFMFSQGGYGEELSGTMSGGQWGPPGLSGGDTGGTPRGYGGIPEDEPPLLEELGINFDHILSNTKAVLNPRLPVDREMDTDLAGPFCYAIALGFSLLLSGKTHGFGYIYGVGLFGWIGLYLLLRMMSDVPVDMYQIISVLGYGLLPLVILALFAPIVSLQSLFGMVLSALCIVWSTYTAARFFVTVLAMNNQQPLVAYPVFLFYTTFALITVF